MSDSAAESPELRVAPPVAALLRLLGQLRDVVAVLDPVAYAVRMPGRPSGSIGAHVRHCLDHVAALLHAAGRGALSYDHRARGTDVEASPVVGVAHIERLARALVALSPAILDEPLALEVQLDPSGASCSVMTTLGRELTYVISHTVHHQATMAVLLSEAGVPLPDRFGVAAATPGASCAR